jgi:hypothetical protein
MRHPWTQLVLLTAALAFAAGCGGGRQAPDAKPPAEGKKEKKKSHEHNHPDHGPHGGPLVEWGDGDYHVEVTADRAKGEVTVYILSDDAETAEPIKADKVQLTNKDPAFQVDLKPAPLPGDPPGTASRFTGPLPESARGRRLSGTVTGVVGGKPYAGDFREVPAHKD